MAASAALDEQGTREGVCGHRYAHLTQRTQTSSPLAADKGTALVSQREAEGRSLKKGCELQVEGRVEDCLCLSQVVLLLLLQFLLIENIQRKGKRTQIKSNHKEIPSTECPSDHRGSDHRISQTVATEDATL